MIVRHPILFGACRRVGRHAASRWVQPNVVTAAWCVIGRQRRRRLDELRRSSSMLEVVETVGRRVRGPDAPLTTSELPVTSELPGERNNAGNSVKCTKARKTTHGLDGQHQDVDRTPRECRRRSVLNRVIMICSVLQPSSIHGRTFSIYLRPLSF